MLHLYQRLDELAEVRAYIELAQAAAEGLHKHLKSYKRSYCDISGKSELSSALDALSSALDGVDDAHAAAVGHQRELARDRVADRQGLEREAAFAEAAE